MADRRPTRQELYDRIKESSRDAVVLEEMKRLGFWQEKGGLPSLPEIVINRQAELNKELTRLIDEKRKYQNKEALLKEMRLKRMKEAKEKREENKKRREQQRYERAEAWRKRKAVELLHLGEEVSMGLNHVENDLTALQKYGLPLFKNENELASVMGITLKELAFLSFSRKVSTVNHYRKFYLPKKSGGKRLISAPMPRIKNAQYWILEHILDKIPVHSSVHGFAASRSILTNARLHVGKELVLNIDLKDFFPSIHYKRVKGLLRHLGYSEKIATPLALICTESVTEEVEMDGKKYFVQQGARVLPQGAPTSPAITNILCYQLDKRLSGMAQKNKLTYTRYADDMTFSTEDPGLNVQSILWRIKKILADEGFVLHPEKIRVMRKSNRQEVTGIVVNEKPAISRQKLRQFRAAIHRLDKQGLSRVEWGNGDAASALLGYANFIKMVDPVKGTALKQKVAALLSRNQ